MLGNRFFLFCSLTDRFGGAEQLLFKLARFYSGENKISVCFFGKKTNDFWEFEGFDVYYCNGSFIKLFKFLYNNNFDIVFSSHLMMNALLGGFRSLGLLKTRKLVCRESTSVFVRYSGFKLLKYKLAYLFGYRKIDLLITQSDFMKELLLENLPLLEKRINIVTIPNLFEFPKVVNDKNIYDFPYIVSAGRLIPEKGFDILINSFLKVRSQFPFLHLVILGEGEEREILSELISKLSLQEFVHLEGFVKDVYPYFKNAELCVVSSRIEGFPNVLLQMMSQNNKVVSTLCAGGIDKIDGVMICSVDNENELTTAILKSLAECDSFQNRELYDLELKGRSIENFINKIESHI